MIESDGYFISSSILNMRLAAKKQHTFYLDRLCDDMDLYMRPRLQTHTTLEAGQNEQYWHGSHKVRKYPDRF